MSRNRTPFVGSNPIARVIAGIALSTLMPLTLASSMTTYWGQNGAFYISLEGKIEPADPARLNSTLMQAKAQRLPVWGIVLNSPGGDVAAGLQLAATIRKNNLSTWVGAKQYCVSACFYLFAAGTNRWADTTAYVGVHSAAEGGRETANAKAATIDFSRVLATLDVPDAILGKIIRTSPAEVYYLSSSDLSSMGVKFTATPASNIQNVLANAGLSQSSQNNTVLDRKNARELNKLGLVALNSNQHDQAATAFTQAATLYPFDAEILGNLGYAQYLNGRHKAALESLLTSLKLKPDRAVTLQNIGLVYAELGDIQKAAQYFLAYINAAQLSEKSLATLQKWAADDSNTQRAQAAQMVLNSM